MIARITGMPWGMGDGVWMLPILRYLHKQYETIYLETPWPQMYWGFDWIRCMNPANSDSEYRHWTMFKESYESVPESTWVTDCPADAVDVPVCNTGDYSTRLRSFYTFPDDAEADMSFPLEPEWIEEAKKWIASELWVPGCSDPMENRIRPKPRVLMHIPMQREGASPAGLLADTRYCNPGIFCDLSDEFHRRVEFFDVQRVVKGENEPTAYVTMPIMPSDGAHAPILWAITALADAIVTTDNHMLPLALAFKKPTLYLAGGVSLSYLFDPRIDASRVVSVSQGRDPIHAFNWLLGRVRQ